jgi:hypothetical protein
MLIIKNYEKKKKKWKKIRNIKIYANFHIFGGHLGFLGYTNTIKTLKSTKKVPGRDKLHFKSILSIRSIFVELRAARHAFRPTVRHVTDEKKFIAFFHVL